MFTLAMVAEISRRTVSGILLTGRPLTWYLRATRLMMLCSIRVRTTYQVDITMCLQHVKEWSELTRQALQSW
jgi:hypothetical protein